MRWLWSILLILVLVPTYSGEPRRPLLRPAARMTMRAVALDPTDPGRRRVGALAWLGGVQLSSSDPAFGGFSALRVQGRHFTLLSDFGTLVDFDMASLGQFRALRFRDLPAGPDGGWRKRERDSESLAGDPCSGGAWIGFENSNELWRYSSSLGRAVEHGAPPVMAGWPENLGPEAIAMVPALGLVVLAEAAHWPRRSGTGGVVFQGDPVREPRRGFRFTYLPPAGYDPSDMTLLPDGRLLVLNRGFALPFRFSAKLVVIDPAAILPDAQVSGTELATLAAPLIHDNFEGVAATREGAATIVWLVSDDNQSELQRTLLLAFRLDRAGPARTPRCRSD